MTIGLMASPSPEQMERMHQAKRRLASDFPFYAFNCLRIRPKDGEVKPLKLNSAQKLIHERIEAQLAQTGKVRAIILKGRQQGCSTYVEGRYYWKVSHRKGVRAFILTHEQDATDNLFEMAERYHEHCPPEHKPHTGASNAKELYFDRLDSGYKVGTAGTKAVGRSQTIQFFHGSEVAFWPHPEDHARGVLQAVPDEPGTEVILESTSDGPGDFFHGRWQAAVRGEGGFIAIFIPWYLQSEYRASAHGFKRTADETEYAAVCGGLADEQLAWRRAKIADLGGGDEGEESFRREYPATPEEAFEASSKHSVVPSHLVRQAIGRKVKPTGRVVWGLDVARYGGDRCALARRMGNTVMGRVEHWSGLDTMQTAGKVFDAYKGAEDKPEVIFVDVIGLGAGVVDRLAELRLPVIGVNVAEAPAMKEQYHRLKDELWFAAREWFEARDVCIPADEPFIAELTAVRYDYTSGREKKKVESKDEMEKRGLRSPDLADAFILTFAQGSARTGAQSYFPEHNYDH